MSLTEMREERLKKLMDDCQQQVISQIIGPFGLSTAMFKDVDKAGGNVTTVHNFKNGIAATDSDKVLSERYKQTIKEYDRKSYQVSDAAWKEKRTKKIDKGIDDYRGVKITHQDDVDLDHIVPVKAIATDARIHLGMAKVDDSGGADLSAIKRLINDDKNLAITDGGLNSSKKDHKFEKWSSKTRSNGKTNAEHFEVDEARAQQIVKVANEHVEAGAKAAWDKQKEELISTGKSQAINMATRQALGVLLTELVNGLFNEFKVLINAGVEAGKTLFEEIRERLQRVIASVVRKIPDAASQAIQGGVSGFMSNLITFLINNFMSTAKRFVTIIREGLLGLVKAFKMIMFPPKCMTSSEALQEGLKVLTAVVVTSVGFLLQESVATFLKTLPFLLPIADIVSGVLVGIMTGLLSAFLAYQLDNVFARYRYAYDEKFLDAIATDAKLTEKMAGDLVEASKASLSSIAKYTESIKSYETTGELLGAAGRASQAVVSSLVQAVESAKTQVAETKEMISYLDETNALLDDFFGKKATE